MTRTTRKPGFIAIVLFACSAGFAGTATAAEYPNRPIRLFVPFAAGSATDISARIYAAQLGEQMGQQLVADNRPGAGGLIGMQMIAQATPDGYTIGYAGAGPLSINPSVTPNLPYNVARDFAPVSQAVQAPLMMASSMSLPAKSVKELVALARAKPGALSNASAGTGTIGYLAGEYFKIMTNTRILHVPYKGGAQAAVDVISGNVQFMFDPINGVSPHIKAGKLRGLGVTGTKRVAAFPDIPTVAEAGVPGYEVTTWGGIIAPAAVPKPIITRLHAEMQKAAKSRMVNERYATLGADPVSSTPEQFTKFIRAETVKWADVVKRTQAQAN